MSIVTVSSRFQIVIPRALRETLEIRPGQKMATFNVNGTIRLVPVLPMSQLGEFLKGMGSEGLREKRDRAL
ncbi:MAG TPA: AbrB/MazE/SpoVT family DNA-binding domain-containing protein [Tepidisphaeraceae bacterium]|nr:AbrB/MazE/SpoVT family DNA-binding domain-containing protein [Tepidisphaeraceae bacterium]HUB26743.1 AbrB/MazE/SpoVT family DNA-binding domain-containing protein [Tepidisphaeraceae bacterium]